MRVLCAPRNNSFYLRVLNRTLRELGPSTIDEVPFPYVRWPRGFMRFSWRAIRPHDLWHFHWQPFDSVAVMRTFMTRRVPKVWTVHNIVPHVPVTKVDAEIARYMLDNVDVAVWHSERSIREAEGLFRSWEAENVVIPHVSANGVLPDTVSREAAKRALGFDGFVVGHFAPSRAYKGSVRFLRAIRALRASGVPVSSCIFGECRDGNLRRILEVESAAVGTVLDLRRIPDEELQYWFKACDVVVQPYEKVTTAGSLYFAMAFQTPVIASPHGNVPDVVIPGETGWLGETPREIAEAVKEAYDRPELAMLYGRSAHRLVGSTASPGQVALQYLEAYREAIDSHRSGRGNGR